MKRFVITLAIVASLGICAAIPSLITVSGQNPNKFRRADAQKRIRGEYIVVLNNNTDPDAESLRIARDYSGDRGHTYRRALKGFSVRMSEQSAMRLADDPRVAFVEEDSEVNASATQSPATWGLDRIDQRDLPLNNTYNYNATGTGVTAYIIDTGIRATHNEIAGRVISGFTSIIDGNGTNDCHGHGTHVSGTVGGTTYGVAKNVTLVAVRVLNCSGSGSTSGVIAGVDWVTADHQAGTPAVANMSLGGSASTALDTAVENSIADGVTYAIAAGNSNVSACTQSPARAPNAITVGATTMTDARSSFSNFGTCLDIFAPGSSITSAWSTSDTATNTISGTSMAAPHVAGVAALFLETAPGSSPATVTAAIINSATLNKVTNPGAGSPNRLLYSLLTGPPPPSPTPTPTPSPSPTPTPTPTPVPAAPSNLSATAVSTSQINLVWTDNANNESGFRIERCQGNGCTNFVQIAEIAVANTTSYSNTGLNNNTRYRYRVRAYNGTGNSGYSNIADAKTPRR